MILGVVPGIAATGDRQRLDGDALAACSDAFPGAVRLMASFASRRRRPPPPALCSPASRRRFGVPLLATNDVLYHAPGAPAAAGRAHLHPRARRRLPTAGKLLAANAERHLKDAAEMARLFRDYPEAVAEIDARCWSASPSRSTSSATSIPTSRPATPHARRRRSTRLAEEGARFRYPDGVPEQGHGRRIAHELATDRRAATTPPTSSPSTTSSASPARRSILCQGRGSAANSAVCFCLGITEVDPEQRRPPLRALHLARAQRAARHRRRFRARAARGGDAVHLREIRPRPRRHRRHRHHLPHALGDPRGRQGLRPLARTPSARSPRPSGAGRRRACARPTSAAPASTRPSRTMRQVARLCAAS